MKTVLLYSFFAVVAIAANMLGQAISIRMLTSTYALMGSILIGTAAGLVVKYVLDRRFIFGVQRQALSREGATLAFYSITGVGTTAIFWGTELAFHAVFDAEVWRYIGGVLGLTLGYILKFRLDRRYVFSRQALQS